MIKQQQYQQSSGSHCANYIDIMHKSSPYWDGMLPTVRCSGVKQDRNTCGWAPRLGSNGDISALPTHGLKVKITKAPELIHIDLFTQWNHIPCVSDPLPKHLSQAAGAIRHPGGLLSEQLSMGTEAILPGS